MVPGNVFAIEKTQASDRLKIHIFSKHLQFLDYRELAEAAVDMGFDGVDLTVRPNGHVLPERVEADLPKAVEALRNAGLSPLMITTAVDDADDPTDKKLLQVAATQGIKNYRMNWLPYPENKTIPEGIRIFAQKIKALSLLNNDLHLTGVYQNHAGLQAGASLWELWEMTNDADHEHMGIQYDIRHAVVEGGLSWQNGLRLVHSRIKALTIKDFRWEQQNGKWVVQDVPIGEGMVDFKTYFGLLKKLGVNVPVSLHIEYPLGGVEHGATKISINKQEVFRAMKKDLQKVQQLWKEA